jgi:hypothetical protein
LRIVRRCASDTLPASRLRTVVGLMPAFLERLRILREHEMGVRVADEEGDLLGRLAEGE